MCSNSPVHPWTELRTFFDELVELDPTARAVRLSEIGSHDAQLRIRLEAMLAADAGTDSRLREYEELAGRLGLAAEGTPRERDPLGLLGCSVGRYHIDALLGTGGMGVVYRATDRRLSRVAAIKFLPPAWNLDGRAKLRFLHEARGASSLDHANVCTIYEADETADGILYIAMACYEGQTLRERLERGPLEIAEALDLVAQAARGLAAAHRRDLVHRDIKPANLLVTTEGTLKILDFGVAKVGEIGLTLPGQCPGTAAYMAPEQERGDPVDGRADLWSLGVVAYEALTGARPGARASGEIAPPSNLRPGVPASVDTLVLRLLEHEPRDRPASAAAVARALERGSAERIGGLPDDLAAGAGGNDRGCPTCGQRNRRAARFCDVCGNAIASSRDVPSARSTVGPADEVFVGRGDELGELGVALDAVFAGRGRLVMLIGEPGIGKTHTARQLEAVARARGARALWGRCFEGGGAPPFWVWRQSIRAYVQEADANALRDELGVGAPDIAEVIPEIRRVLPEIGAPPVLQAEQARFRFYDSVVAFLKRASDARPLVFFLDDLHWADRPSLLLLEFLASELAGSRILLVGTCRDSELSRGHPLARTMGQITKEPAYQPIPLAGLSDDDVSAYLAEHTGASPTRSLVDTVQRQAEGNPFFIKEFVRFLEQEGFLSPDIEQAHHFSPPEHVPRGVREVIGKRLERLPGDSQRMLRVASLVGRTFDIELVAKIVADLEPERVADAVEAAVAPGIVETTGVAPRHYRFTHALVQQTLREELTHSERRALHTTIAREFEQRYGAEAELHAGELAHHLTEARLPDPRDLIKYSALAGEQALGSHADEDAVRHFRQALNARRGRPMDAEAASILRGLGRAQTVALPRNRLPGAVATLRKACDYHVAAGNIEEAVTIATTPFYPLWGQPSGQTGMIRSVLTAVQADSVEAALLSSRYARLVAFEDCDAREAESVAADALSIASKHGDPALELRVLADAANVLLSSGKRHQCETAVELGTRGLELAHGVPDPQADLDVRYSAALSSFVLGDPAGIVHFGFGMLQLAERLRDRFWLASAHRTRALYYWQLADLEAARAETQASLSFAPNESRDLVIGAAVEYEAGEFARGEYYLGRLLDLERVRGSIMERAHAALIASLAARVHTSADRLSTAGLAALSVLRITRRTFGLAAEARVSLALSAIVRGDETSAHEQYEAMDHVRGQGIPYTTTCGDRLLALLARTFGESGLARNHFEDALAYCQDKDVRLELAWVLYDFADFLADSAHHSDRRRSRELADHALRLAEERGLRPLYDRAAKLRRRIVAPPL